MIDKKLKIVILNKCLIFKIIVLMFMFENTYCQTIEKIRTSDFDNYCLTNNIDSTIKYFGNQPIFLIDTAISLKLIDKINEYKPYSYSEGFLSKFAQNYKNDKISKVIVKLFDQYSAVYRRENRIARIPDELLLCILYQTPDSIDKKLNAEYIYWNRVADSLYMKFPSKFKRFWYSFKGTYPIVENYYECNLNCYKIQWTLQKLNSKYYESEKIEYHNRETQSWQRNYNVERFRETQDYKKGYKSEIFKLSKDYNSVDEIDFYNETSLNQIMVNNNSEKCWKTLIFNGKYGILNIGCIYAPLAGNGEIYMIQLIDKNKVEFKLIGAWIS